MKEIEINGKTYQIKEIAYVDAMDIDPTDKKEAGIKMLKSATGLTDEEIAKLTLKEGLEIQNAITEVNGLSDFQIPAKKTE